MACAILPPPMKPIFNIWLMFWMFNDFTACFKRTSLSNSVWICNQSGRYKHGPGCSSLEQCERPTSKSLTLHVKSTTQLQLHLIYFNWVRQWAGRTDTSSTFLSHRNEKCFTCLECVCKIKSRFKSNELWNGCSLIRVLSSPSRSTFVLFVHLSATPAREWFMLPKQLS